MSEINKNRTVHRAVPRQFGATALCVLGCSLASNAGTIDYTFVNIADSTGPLSTSFDGAVVNDSGEVAFWVMLDISGQMRIYRGDGGPGGLTTIAAAGSGQQFDSLSHPSINSSGDVAFRATFPDGDAILSR